MRSFFSWQRRSVRSCLSSEQSASESEEQERTHGKQKRRDIAERLEAATDLLEKTLNWLEERQRDALAGEVERISATVEQSRREAELAEKLAAAERELAELKAAAAQNVLNPLRRTLPAATSRDAGQARHRRGPGGCAHAGCGAGGAEPGAAHRGEDATAAGGSNRVEAVVSYQ